MRRIVIFNRVSADGYFATTEGGIEWPVQDEELDRRATRGIPGIDTLLFGRRTYDMFESFWPHVIDESPTAPSPHGPPRRSPELRAMGALINEATKLVISANRKTVSWRNSRLLPAFDPAEIEAIKRQPGKDIMVFGSGSIVAQLTRYRLIDEYQLVVSPVLLGGGRPWLTGVPEATRLALIEAVPFASGNVMLRYAPA